MVNINNETIDKNVINTLLELAKNINLKLDDSLDYYSQLCAKYFDLPYEECCEFKDDKPYPIGKHRRTMMKYFVMRLTYNE